MSDEIKHSMIWGFVAIVVGVTGIWGIAYPDILAIENGYTREVIPGSSTVQWVKRDFKCDQCCCEKCACRKY